MPVKRLAEILLITFLIELCGCAGTSPQRVSEADLPSMRQPSDVLFWTPEQRELGFRAMERIAPHRSVAAGNHMHPLARGKALDFDPEPYMRAHRSVGILVLQDGHIRLERYAMDFRPLDRWTSFSVAKSVTSTLVGMAIAEGRIESLDTPITRYLPELEGSAYDGVSVRQLLTMTSGADWNEDYEDPQSDVARFFSARDITPGMDPTLDYMRQLKRVAEPGTRWHYSTGETSLVGVLVSRATGEHLADYLSRKLWQPYGMERDAAWMIDEAGQEPGGCCLVATLRDWGRVGQFVLDGGMIDGQRSVPDNWFAQATTRQADIGVAGRGYGFQWWTHDDGSFTASGIYGQMIHIVPQEKLVIVLLSAWPVATTREEHAARTELVEAIRAAAAH